MTNLYNMEKNKVKNEKHYYLSHLAVNTVKFLVYLSSFKK